MFLEISKAQKQNLQTKLTFAVQIFDWVLEEFLMVKKPQVKYSLGTENT